MCIRKLKTYDHLPNIITAYKTVFKVFNLPGQAKTYMPPFFNTPIKLNTFIYSDGIRQPDIGNCIVGWKPFDPSDRYKMGCHLFLKIQDAKKFFGTLKDHTVLECRVLKRNITGYGFSSCDDRETISVTKYFPYHVVKD